MSDRLRIGTGKKTGVGPGSEGKVDCCLLMQALTEHVFVPQIQLQSPGTTPLTVAGWATRSTTKMSRPLAATTVNGARMTLATTTIGPVSPPTPLRAT